MVEHGLPLIVDNLESFEVKLDCSWFLFLIRPSVIYLAKLDWLVLKQFIVSISHTHVP